MLACDLEDLGHLVRRAGQHEDEGDHGHGRERLVVGVVGVHGRTGHDVALADGLAQLLQEFGHPTGHPHLGSIGRTDLTGRYCSASGPSAASASRRRSSATRAETSAAAVGAASFSSSAMARSMGASHGLGSRADPSASPPGRSDQLHHSSSSERVSAT